MSKKSRDEVIEPSVPNWRTDVLVIGLPHVVLPAAEGVAAQLGIDADYATATAMPEHWGVLQSVWLPPRWDTMPETFNAARANTYSKAPELGVGRTSFQAPIEPTQEVLQVNVQRWGSQYPLTKSERPGAVDILVVQLTCTLPPGISGTCDSQTIVCNMDLWSVFELLKQPGGDVEVWLKMWNQDAHKKKLAAAMLSQIPTVALGSWIRRLNTHTQLQNNLPTPASPKPAGRL